MFCFKHAAQCHDQQVSLSSLLVGHYWTCNWTWNRTWVFRGNIVVLVCVCVFGLSAGLLKQLPAGGSGWISEGEKRKNEVNL